MFNNYPHTRGILNEAVFRFGTVRKRCVAKQKKDYEHSHTHTFNSKWNRNTVFNVYVLEDINLRFLLNSKKYDHSDSYRPISIQSSFLFNFPISLKIESQKMFIWFAIFPKIHFNNLSSFRIKSFHICDGRTDVKTKKECHLSQSYFSMTENFH